MSAMDDYKALRASGVPYAQAKTEVAIRGKPWLVGEQNPYSSGQKLSLWPDPPNASGGRIMRILGMDRATYLDTFVRWNLLTRADGPWAARRAAWAALGVAAMSADAPVVMLGSKVTRAFGIEYRPFAVTAGKFLCLPHPSGLNRAWNDPGAVEAARRSFQWVRDYCAFSSAVARRAAP